MFSEAAPDGDWALAENQMPDRQIATKVMSREKTIFCFLLSGPSGLRCAMSRGALVAEIF
jgi:hypothetical protein